VRRQIKPPSNPIERIVAKALDCAGLDYECPAYLGARGERTLDFKVGNVYIECKAAHTDRVASQTALVDNIIVIQGRHAALMFAKWIER